MKLMIPLITLGMFCVLASFAYGRITPLPHKEANIAHKQPVQDKCGDDWLCLVAWADDQHPTKHKRRKA